MNLNRIGWGVGALLALTGAGVLGAVVFRRHSKLPVQASRPNENGSIATAKIKKGQKFIPVKAYTYTRNGKRIKVSPYRRSTPD